jgi:hypothetical protein
MSDEREFSDLIDAGPRGPTVQIALEEERPELVACLEGLHFRAGGGALRALLEAAIRNLVSEILTNLSEEADLSELIVDVEARAAQLPPAARALRWEFEKQGPPPPDLGKRSAAYRAETLEHLHGPPPPIRLDRPELEISTRMAKSSLEDEAAQEHDQAASRRQELKALLDGLALVEKADFPYLVTELPMPRLLAWLDHWFHDLGAKGPVAESELEVVQGMGRRIEPDWIGRDDAGQGKASSPA